MKDAQQRYEEREWFTEVTTGERGYKIKRDGREVIRYDRGPNSPEVDFDKGRWVPQKDPERKLTATQVAFVLHQADLALAKVLNDPDGDQRQWLSMPGSAQTAVFVNPPAGRKMRTRLWAYMRSAFKPHLDKVSAGMVEKDKEGRDGGS